MAFLGYFPFLKTHKLVAQFRRMFGIIETMFFLLLGAWFSVYPSCEYYSDRGFPKSIVIADIQPMASIRQERV